MQVRDVLPQPFAMRGMSFQIVWSVVQFLVFALKGFAGADQLLMLVFEVVVHTWNTAIAVTPQPHLARSARF